MTAFAKFSQAVHAASAKMASFELYQSGVDKDAFYAAYLAAFPAGTNEIFRARTEHDCSCCRNFIKNLGTAVAISKGELVTVWDDYQSFEYPYNEVAQELAMLLRTYAVTGVYRTKEVSYGKEKTFELIDGNSKQWNHFHGLVYPRHRTDNPAADAGELNQTAQVFQRGLDTITGTALIDVIELIQTNSIYRGEEFLAEVLAFQKLQDLYYGEGPSDLFAWEHLAALGSRIRNKAIGTLLVDLSDGMELELAVKAFEKKVAPENYKRSKSLITPAMIKAAVAKLQDLGLEQNIQRRFAKLSDVTVNNVLWVDRAIKDQSEGGLLTRALMGSTQVKPVGKDVKALEIDAKTFMDTILPSANTMEVLVKNSMTGNFVSLTAPAHENEQKLFKWDNEFAWSYNGSVTDSIKEKVKRAGGNTNAKLRVSLAWFNSDDLDIYADCPDGHIYFGRKQGILDIDMNAGYSVNSTDPVENLSWANPRDGLYTIGVNQYNQRGTVNPGYVLEVENNGTVTQFSMNSGAKGRTDCLELEVKNGAVVSVIAVNKALVGKGIEQNVWGVMTEQFVKVETVMYSPNCWDDKVLGNKHLFMMLEGCKNPEPTRGIYNEFLTNDLLEHRKVFEVLGAQTMCQPTDDQLSGVGFSSTRKDLVTIRVNNTKGTAVFNVQF